MRTGRIVAAVATALAVALVGCGGGGRLSKAEYEQKLHRAGNDLAASVQQLAKATSTEEFKRDVGDVQRALDDSADDLDGITPPSDVESANERLVDGLRGLARDFGKVKEAADQGVDAATRKARQITSGTSSREAQQAVQEIKRRGYDVGQLGS